ncbi:SAM-dependent methyltransferase [Mucilaginibacter ginsenosidivorax]|uniref:SAM-dependent methyltransferase n=1 Tax=Mucilaginibacter ginsenosidivorax TaxID=862126 RepID=A0A5B8W9N4_9SPHI|nr:SAM-dependent methyltransferase [Mucilaginibacter ginsenosidivorax]QEC79675.1 SAM-dependent methyltransferase [Mucilaginibacter ginsenosidivorax]
MSFTLKSVVPWGRTLAEYQKMFGLTPADVNLNILSVGDGPASFNAELTRMQGSVTSIDPVYQFSKTEIEQRIIETKTEVIEQMTTNYDKFVWNEIKTIDDLVSIRMNAMKNFLADFEKGKNEGRYVTHMMPDKTPYRDQQFDIGLSSHFLLLYANLGVDFHIATIQEMLRVCKQVRIFPVLNLDAQKNHVIDTVLDHFAKHYVLKLVKVDYEFQKGGNHMLQIHA